MKAMPYSERIERSLAIPAEGQFAVMGRMEQFCAAEIRQSPSVPAEKPTELRCAVFNMEHGYRNPEIAAFIAECPTMQGLDILFANELDDGTERSGNINTAEQLSDLMKAGYAYGLEFVELANSRDLKGYEGNAIFSRWPIVKAESFYVPEAYNWYFDRQTRIGGRVDIFAELDVAGTHIGAVCVHLENRCASAGRAAQMQATIEHAKEYFGDMPIIIGGDCNTYAFNDAVPAESQGRFNAKLNGIPCIKAEDGEEMFRVLTRAGYDFKSFNGTDLSTRRKPLKDGDLELHLDWIFGKGIECVEHGVLSTILSDCTFAKEDSILRKCTFRQLSDHNAIYAVCRL